MVCGERSSWLLSIRGIVGGVNGLIRGAIPFPRPRILPRSPAGDGEDDDDHEQRRAEQQQLVENADFAMQQRDESG